MLRGQLKFSYTSILLLYKATLEVLALWARAQTGRNPIGKFVDTANLVDILSGEALCNRCAVKTQLKEIL